MIYDHVHHDHIAILFSKSKNAVLLVFLKGLGIPHIIEEDPFQQEILVKHGRSGAWSAPLLGIYHQHYCSNRHHEYLVMYNQARHKWRA
jgi:hypothetical protein